MKKLPFLSFRNVHGVWELKLLRTTPKFLLYTLILPCKLYKNATIDGTFRIQGTVEAQRCHPNCGINLNGLNVLLSDRKFNNFPAFDSIVCCMLSFYQFLTFITSIILINRLQKNYKSIVHTWNRHFLQLKTPTLNVTCLLNVNMHE